MSDQRIRDMLSLNRRRMMGYTAGAGLAAGFGRSLPAFGQDSALSNPDQWTPDYIESIAGTLEVDTAAECAKVVPLDYAGHVTYWHVGANEASPPLEKHYEKEFFKAFKETYPNITIETVSIGYNDIFNKLRTAALGNAAPMVARLMLLWGCEFAAKGQLVEFAPEDVGYDADDFWPGAMKSARWRGKTYGVPTNNETMGLIYNVGILEEAGLGETPPKTWQELVQYSAQIHENTGREGFGLVARVNAGNTPYRFMPMAWAYGGGALDEASPNPTYETITIGNEGTQAALQDCYDMYVRDKSVPTSALTNTNTENNDPFIAGNLAMMIAHPGSYAYMVDRLNNAQGDERAAAQQVVENMRYGLLPEGPVRRSAVFGGWNAHMFKPEVVGSSFDEGAAKALITFMTGPEWSVKLAWANSNPGNLRGFRTKWMKERLETIRFLDVTTSMLPYGIPFPVIPEGPEIMNIIVPDMLQNALTERMTVAQACEDAESKVQALMQGI